MTEPQRGQPGTPAWFGFWNDAGELDHGRTLAGLPATDQDAATLIMAERPGQFHYVPVGRAGTWYIWDGRCHRPDESSQIVTEIAAYAERAAVAIRQIKQQVLARSRNALTAADPEATETAIAKAGQKAWEPWQAAEKYHLGLRKTAANAALRGMLAGLSGTRLDVMTDAWPHHLNCANGIVDLRTGAMYPHDPAAMMTYCLDVPYDPAARCPRYWELASRACGNVQAVAEFLWRVLGYCLIGENPEQKIFFLSGPTGSGKSQVLEAVGEVLGPLYHNSQNSLISVNKTGRNARTEWSCFGSRLVAITETSGHNTTDEAQVKRLTGERWISVDRHYAETEMKMKVTFTIIQATNEMQTLTNFDAAIRRRVLVLPMGEPVPDELQIKSLAEKIAAAEGPGILAMLVAGAMAYFRDGLHPPVEVQVETARYEAQQNTLTEFLADCTMPVPAALGNGQNTASVSQREMWAAYLAYSRGGPHLRKHPFLDQLRNHPGIFYREGSRRFEGLALVDEIRIRMDES